MNHQKGFIPAVIIILISVLAVSMIGVSVYYKMKKSQQPIECQKYFDGCNVCERFEDGGAVCTDRYCSPEEYEPYRCLDGESATNTNTAANANTTANTNTVVDETAGWETYTNTEKGFTLRYPEGWIVTEATQDQATVGSIVYLRSPETQQLLDNRQIDPGYADDLVVSFWPDINNEYARGGSWEGQREYTGLDDFFTAEFSFKNKTGEITVDGQRAYEVVIGGAGANYGVMMERGGIYELSFDTARDKSHVSVTQQQILSTFQFLDDTTGWETYMNSSLGFVVQHPKDWVAAESTLNGEEGVSIYFSITNESKWGSPGVQIRLKQNLYPQDFCLESESQFLMNGVERNRQKEGCAYAGSTVATFFSKGTSYLAVEWTTDWEEYYSTYETILSTFEFTE